MVQIPPPQPSLKAALWRCFFCLSCGVFYRSGNADGVLAECILKSGFALEGFGKDQPILFFISRAVEKAIVNGKVFLYYISCQSL